MAELARPVRADRTRHRFPPLEKRGVIAGWRGGQIAAVAVSLLVAVLAVRSRPSIAGIAAGTAAVALGLAVAFWPVRGRTAEQWLPLVARWAWGSAAGRSQLSPSPRLGRRATVDLAAGPMADVDLATTGPAGRKAGGSGAWRAGGRSVFDGLRLVGVQIDSGSAAPRMAVVFDAPVRTATAVLAVRGHSFALLGPSDQDSRVAAWARVLAALAREGSDVHRLQWVESCLPDDGRGVRGYWEERGVAAPDSPAGRSYRSLITETAPATRRHQMLVALSIHTSRAARTIRSEGGGDAGAARVLLREVLSLKRALEGADIEVEGVVGPGAFARVIRDAVSGPADQTGPGAGRGEGRGEPVPDWPWPMVVEPCWDSVRTDAVWHATYWIAEWPRVDVTPDFLGPLFFSPLRRSIAVTMEPVSPSRAARQVARSRTAELADGELRRRGGFLVTARHTRERQSVEDRDVELADGHAQFRFSGYVGITADSPEELMAARSTVEHAAGQARIELRLLYGEQDGAFTCTLPLGRGLA